MTMCKAVYKDMYYGIQFGVEDYGQNTYCDTWYIKY